jgi:hypothetical protein
MQGRQVTVIPVSMTVTMFGCCRPIVTVMLISRSNLAIASSSFSSSTLMATGRSTPSWRAR